MAVAETSVRRSPESTEVDAREQHWRRVRRRAAVGYFVILALFVLLVGVPTDRAGLLLWTLAGLGIRCLGRGWPAFGRVLLDWLPFTGVLLLYDYTRGVADTLGMPVHVHEPANADLWMFHGVLPTAWMQQHFYVPGHAQWYDAVVTLVYTSHFIVTPVVAAVLWIRNRREWVRFISRVIALAFAGLATYILYPAAPPWYAARDGVIEPVLRISSRGWTELGLNHAGQVLSKGQAGVNLVAAMPSLHTAYATLVALYFMRRARWWGRVLLTCYPLTMGAALVYSGEHYAVDVFFGWAAAGAVTAGVAMVERRLAGRRATQAAPVGAAPTGESVGVRGVEGALGASGSSPTEVGDGVGGAATPGGGVWAGGDSGHRVVTDVDGGDGVSPLGGAKRHGAALRSAHHSSRWSR